MSYDFVSFYRQLDGNNNITAVMSRLDGNFTLSYYPEIADCGEICAFLHAVGYNSVLSDSGFDFDSPYDTGVVMKTERKAEYYSERAVLDEYPKLMDLFSLDDYSTADFEAWYVDLSHRIRHNSAKAYSLNVDGETVASGIFSSIYDSNAVLTSVNTRPLFRRKGYGRSLVSQMICDIKGTVYLMREENKNEEFYLNLGFINNGKWRMYK